MNKQQSDEMIGLLQMINWKLSIIKQLSPYTQEDVDNQEKRGLTAEFKAGDSHFYECSITELTDKIATNTEG